MKRIECLVLALALTAFLCACGTVEQDTDEPVQEQTETATETEETTTPEAAEQVSEAVGVANPMEEMTAQELSDAMGLDFTFLEAYENADFCRINGSTAVGQVQFCKDGDTYCWRVAMPAEATDISGMYYDWTETEEVQVGYNTATLNLTQEGQGVISWYDAVPGIQYSLSMSENATAEKLTELANALFSPAQGDAEGDFALEFQAMLPELQENYRPGTAGSSITGAVWAAKLADLFYSQQPKAEDVSRLAQEYATDTLTDAEARSTFAQQLLGIADNYESLRSNGTDILADGGYEAVNAPWDEAVDDLFAALREAVEGIADPAAE